MIISTSVSNAAPNPANTYSVTADTGQAAAAQSSKVPNLTTREFQGAIFRHVLFKSRLRSILYGAREADDALFTLNDTPLGQWLYLTVRPKYGSSPQFAEIEGLLLSMLNTARIMVSHCTGEKISVSRQSLERIDVCYTRIERLLADLES
jgi:hypothetical protein